MRFETTRWSMVLAAKDTDTEGAREAIAELCEAYWFPLYAYIRREGFDAEQARDLTQEFFARFLEKDYLKDVSQDRGRFRSFLLASLRHFLANERRRRRAKKRSGRMRVISLDVMEAEQKQAMAFLDRLTPDKAFDRQWALAILERVMQRLRQDYVENGRGEQFEVLKKALGGEGGSYKELSQAAGMTEGAFKVAVYRLRKRYKEVLRSEIAQTVANEEDIEAELRYLLAALED